MTSKIVFLIKSLIVCSLTKREIATSAIQKVELCSLSPELVRANEHISMTPNMRLESRKT